MLIEEYSLRLHLPPRVSLGPSRQCHVLRVVDTHFPEENPRLD